MVAFMLATGARIGEACALRWSDVDFDHQLVSITGTVIRIPGKGLVISTTKTTTSNRVLQLPGWIVGMLRSRCGTTAKNLRADVTPVFPAPLGGLRDRSNTQAHLREAFKKELKKAGFGALARANHAGCLEQCEHGPTVVIYPQGIWYGRVQVEDVARIVTKTILGGEILNDLLLPDDCLNNPDCPHRRGPDGGQARG